MWAKHEGVTGVIEHGMVELLKPCDSKDDATMERNDKKIYGEPNRTQLKRNVMKDTRTTHLVVAAYQILVV